MYVYSGGCSGYRYGMMLEDQPTPDDNVLNANGVRVYIDNNSVPLIQGSEIDYVDTLMGAGFTVNNPNAVSGCGCGSSFRTADDAGHGAVLLALTHAGAAGARLESLTTPSGSPGGVFMSPRPIAADRADGVPCANDHADPAVPAPHRARRPASRCRSTCSRSGTG